MYNAYVYHLDLCILAYHLYAQTLIWPLDPWYERLARATSDRRTNFMTHTHATFANSASHRGPGHTRGWAHNPALDPVMTKYDRIDPWCSAFAYDGSHYVVYRTPAAITDRIRDVYVCEYQAAPSGGGHGQSPHIGHHKTAPSRAGTDVLYAFEGGTGVIGTSAPAWSIMGFVLKRARTGGGHDVHVVFCGSRSGSAGRAMQQGLFDRGNADWVTDMEGAHVIQDRELSRFGAVVRGFARAVKLALGSITECLRDIDQASGAPHQIYVTGHSLGGALAAQYASAMVCGNYGQSTQVPAGVRAWPWAGLKLFTFGAPVAGGKRFHQFFNAKIDGKRVWVGRDLITQEKRNYHVGVPIRLEGGYSHFKPVLLQTSAHEPAVIRHNLIKLLQEYGEDLTDVPVDVARAPWQVYSSFYEMYENGLGIREQLLDILTADFAQDTQTYLTIFKNVIAMNSSYKMPFIRASEATARQDRVTSGFSRVGFSTQRQAFGSESIKNKLRDQITALSGAQGDMDKFNGLLLILSELVANPSLKIGQIKSEPVIAECLKI